MTGSLAYRKNEDAILREDVPEKYTRLLPHIPGDSVFEIGSAEGVLALLLAKQGREVTALEKSPERHASAIRLRGEWSKHGPFMPPRFLNGEIGNNLDLLAGFETFVAVRVIYYLRDDIDRVFSAVAREIPNVVLCGNRNRANRWRDGVPDYAEGPHNYYASREGMTTLLKRHGYRIVEEVTEGDEIVVGRKDG